MSNLAGPCETAALNPGATLAGFAAWMTGGANGASGARDAGGASKAKCTAARVKLSSLALQVSPEPTWGPTVITVSIEDARDIQAGLDGDGDAYARLVRRYQGEIARYMWRFSRDARTCEELVQDVFVEAFFSLRTYRGRSPFLHWLRRIATRVGYRYWRMRSDKQATAVGLGSDGQSVPLACPAEASPQEAAELVQHVLAKLPPRDRLVLTLMYLEELPVARVAELTGWTKTMVKVQAHRARAKLKRLLDEMEIES